MPIRHGLLIARLTTAVLLTAVIAGGRAWAAAPDNEIAVPRKLAGDEARDAGFVGTAACGACHAAELERWVGSHHDQAMQQADAATVLGNFDDATFTHRGVTTRMFRRDESYFVNAIGPDGKPADFEVLYTFGVDPLQQYLVALPGGRLQALGLAWDSRPRSEGGARWLHLQPDEDLAPGDPLHWTGSAATWNYMCAECHSTRLRRSYDEAHRTYRTTWIEIDVGCEACHGPGAKHVQWAGTMTDRDADEDSRADESADAGSPDSLDGAKAASTERRDPAIALGPGGRERRTAAGASTARPVDPFASRAELATCAPCHARRSPLGDGYTAGDPLEDAYRLAVLGDALYHADGQIDEEVYVHGSFLQSKMFAAGVACSDCHDPHSLRLRAEGNAVCTQCHQATVFDGAAHHFHEPGEPGSNCVDCHAPATTYMQVDPRRDHSFRVPRPDLSAATGAPDACTGCHTDRDPRWAAKAIDDRYGKDRPRADHFGTEIAAVRTGKPGAEERLVKLLSDPEVPGIARATALELLGPRLGRRSIATVVAATRDADPLVRREAVLALAGLPPDVRGPLAMPLLTDPVRSVRLAATEVLMDLDAEKLPEAQSAVLLEAFAAHVAAQEQMADRHEAHANLGNFYRARGNAARAERHYRRAIEIEPAFAGAYVNLADLQRLTGDEEGAGITLELAIAAAPGSAGVQHAYGLFLIRQKRYDEAEKPLAAAAELDPAQSRYAYVYAVYLEQTGNPEKALTTLQGIHRAEPENRDVLLALISVSRALGDLFAATQYAEKLVELDPDDRAARGLLDLLKPPR